MTNTEKQFNKIGEVCREIYTSKLKDYGASWRILRPKSVTDQIYIKANRIRTLEVKGEHKVDEGIRPELIGIVNYGIIGLIQLEMDATEGVDITNEEATELHEKYFTEAKELMMAKNHDYDEAWRLMRSESYTDLILSKLLRIKQIEDNQGKTVASEGIDANYFDIINYAIFGLIKMDFSN